MKVKLPGICKDKGSKNDGTSAIKKHRLGSYATPSSKKTKTDVSLCVTSSASSAVGNAQPKEQTISTAVLPLVSTLHCHNDNEVAEFISKCSNEELMQEIHATKSLTFKLHDYCSKIKKEMKSHLEQDAKKSKGRKAVQSISKENYEWQCETCKVSFHSLSMLTEHKNAVHDNKPYKCEHPSCNKTFTCKNNLKLHVMHHVEGNKTKMCDKYCKLFFHTSEVRAHMATHDVKKHFICEKCRKKFTHHFELNRHIKSCGQTVQCPICPRKIKGEKNLKTI